MYGYVYITENLTNNKLYIGARRAVTYDPKFFGDDPELLADVKRLGEHKFATKMLMPYESETALVAGLEAFLKEHDINNSYNTVESEDKQDKPKRSRRKKSEDEE